MKTVASEIDDDWWCWECHGLGSWPDEDDSGDDVECYCCGGDGVHRGDAKPPCAVDIMEREGEAR